MDAQLDTAIKSPY